MLAETRYTNAAALCAAILAPLPRIAWPELSDAAYKPPGPVLRIPAFDARVMIPARFAPCYVL